MQWVNTVHDSWHVHVFFPWERWQIRIKICFFLFAFVLIWTKMRKEMTNLQRYNISRFHCKLPSDQTKRINSNLTATIQLFRSTYKPSIKWRIIWYLNSKWIGHTKYAASHWIQHKRWGLFHFNDVNSSPSGRICLLERASMRDNHKLPYTN